MAHACGARLLGRRAYEAQGAAMQRSSFCLVPHGDTEVTSRLYSAIAAGCIPVVVADRLSGAFASIVRYSRFWLRINEHAFLRDNSSLWLDALRAMPADERRARRRRVEAARADVVYDGQGSRVAANFLRTAYRGCVLGRETELLGTRARKSHGSKNCTCVRRAPGVWWPPPGPGSGGARVHGLPSELCRASCGVDCGVRCPARRRTHTQHTTAYE